MTKRKGRPHLGRLTDMPVVPPDPPRYEPPPHDEEYDYQENFDDEGRIHKVQRYYEDRFIGFAVTLDRLTPSGWQQLVRIDTAHGEVHLHRYLPTGGEVRTVFEVIDVERAEKVIDRWYGRAAIIVENEWWDFMRRWANDPE
jgi:hypothetical protein